MKIILSFIILSILASCSLFYNPDFANKAVSTSNYTNSTLKGGSDGIIVPGNAVLAGDIEGVSKIKESAFSVDNGDSQSLEISGKTWKARLNITNPGPHTVKVKITDTMGNVSEKNLNLNVPAYVSLSGSDTNCGAFPSQEFSNIQTAVNQMQKFNPAYIYLKGNETYSLSSSITVTNTSNLKIIGGWNSNFTQTSFFANLTTFNTPSAARGMTVSNSYGFKIQNIRIIGNPNSHALNGGGILFYKVNDSEISFSEIYNNIATNGGGVYAEFCTNLLINADCYDCSAISNGGGICSVNSSNISNSSTSYRNSAALSGGAVYISNVQPVTMYWMDLQNNCSGGNGGALAIFNCNDVSYSGSINSNTANSGKFGGGIYSLGCTNLTVTGGLTNNRAGSGGAMYIQFSKNVNLDADFISNSGGNGGALYINNTAPTTLYSGRLIAFNKATSAGGGIYAGATLPLGLFIYSDVNNNTSTLSGGGIYLTGGSNIAITGNIISNFSALNGGGVYEMGCVGFTNYGNVSYNNSASNGGGLNLNNCQNFYFNGNCCYNKSTNGMGGGIYMDTVSNSLIEGQIANNQANSRDDTLACYGAGGGIFLKNVQKTTISSVIANNIALTGHGGGVFGYNTSYITLNGSLISNSAAGNGGGGAAFFDCFYNTVSAIIKYNSANDGGGLHYYNQPNNLTITNCVFDSNVSILYGSAISMIGLSQSAFGTCLISDNWFLNHSLSGSSQSVCYLDLSPIVNYFQNINVFNNIFSNNNVTSGASLLYLNPNGTYTKFINISQNIFCSFANNNGFAINAVASSYSLSNVQNNTFYTNTMGCLLRVGSTYVSNSNWFDITNKDVLYISGSASGNAVR